MNILANADATLSLPQLQELATQMVSKRHEFVKILSALNQQIAKKMDCSIRDAVEAASLREEITRASGIADQYETTISEIEHALRKIESGCYGVSEKSGEPIAYQRLLLIPWARTGTEDR